MRSKPSPPLSKAKTSLITGLSEWVPRKAVMAAQSASLPIVEPSAALNVSVTDDAKKIVFTRLGDRLRVAGTAELSGYNLDLNRVRCEALTRRARDWFGAAIDTSRVEYWTGLRPATPSNVPLIGRTRYPNLYLNTGHGTLG